MLSDWPQIADVGAGASVAFAGRPGKRGAHIEALARDALHFDSVNFQE